MIRFINRPCIVNNYFNSITIILIIICIFAFSKRCIEKLSVVSINKKPVPVRTDVPVRNARQAGIRAGETARPGGQEMKKYERTLRLSFNFLRDELCLPELQRQAGGKKISILKSICYGNRNEKKLKKWQQKEEKGKKRQFVKNSDMFFIPCGVE